MKTLLVIGCGNLTSALLLAHKRVNVNQTFKYLLLSRNLEKTNKLSQDLSPVPSEVVFTYPKNEYIDAIILGVKPTQLKQIIVDYPELKLENAEIISTMAGVSLATLKKTFPKAEVLTRIMPSIVTAEFNSNAIYASTKPSESVLPKWFALIGKLISLKTDAEIDDLTLIFGSNAAFMAALAKPWIENLEAHLGDDKDSQNIILEQMISALQFLKGKSLDEVIEKVKTPGGITAQALEVFAKSDLSQIIQKAISASGSRAQEIGNTVSRDLN